MLRSPAGWMVMVYYEVPEDQCSEDSIRRRDQRRLRTSHSICGKEISHHPTVSKRIDRPPSGYSSFVDQISGVFTATLPLVIVLSATTTAALKFFEDRRASSLGRSRVHIVTEFPGQSSSSTPRPGTTEEQGCTCAGLCSRLPTTGGSEESGYGYNGKTCDCPATSVC